MSWMVSCKYCKRWCSCPLSISHLCALQVRNKAMDLNLNCKATFTRMYGLEMDMQPSRDAMFTQSTRHGMGSVDTRPHGSPSKLGCTCDRHGTAPGGSCVNRRACARNDGRQQRDRFSIRDSIPATEKKNKRWRRAWEVYSKPKESQKIEVLPPTEGTACDVLSLSPKFALRSFALWKKHVDKDEVIGLVGEDCAGKFSRRGLAEKLPNEPCYVCLHLQWAVMSTPLTKHNHETGIIVEKRVAVTLWKLHVATISDYRSIGHLSVVLFKKWASALWMY